MKAKINSQLFPIIRVGMYNDFLSPDTMFGDYLYSEEEENYIDPEYFWDHFQNDKYVKEIERLAQVFFRDEVYTVEGLEFRIKAGEIYSPKFYNFTTDHIDLTIQYDKRKVLKYAKDNQIEFDDYLRRNYSSRDGFISFTANNYPEWLEAFKNNNDQEIGAVLSFIFRDNIEDREFEEDFYTLCQENLYCSEFCDFTYFDKEVEVVKKFVQENFLNLDLYNYEIDYEFEHIKDVDYLVRRVFNDINNQTPTLWERS